MQGQAFLATTELLRHEEIDDVQQTQARPEDVEEHHRVLFNQLWIHGPSNRMDRYIDRFKQRIVNNGLEDLVKGASCLDLGCGNGTFSFALADMGAARVVGIDYGSNCIAHAEEVRASRSNKNALEFKIASVYDLPFADAEFDFLIQNGVFHHLDKLDLAIAEASRVLKPGGHFWYYTDGEEGIAYDLRDCSVHLLKDVPTFLIVNALKSINISADMLTNITDLLTARYQRVSWETITGRLSRAGFGDFKRLRGGFPGNLDEDVVLADPYGREKFGDGDFRILARLTA
jgi:ubiquinone/menaquinone biosynthesis C-methylase UbiE